MCGIGCLIGNAGPQERQIVSRINAELAARGPDSLQRVKVESAVLWASVLAIRGHSLIKQPVVIPGGVLCFNGEIFGGLEVAVKDNDTLVLAEYIQGHGFVDAVSKLVGPFATSYYETSSKSLYVCRDALGRRSLLYQRFEDGLFVGSVACVPDAYATELEPGIVYRIALEHPYEMNAIHKLKPPVAHPADDALQTTDYEQSTAVKILKEKLTLSVQTRLTTLPTPRCDKDAPIAVLFSGGLDSAVLACLVGELTAGRAIDLINVAFESPRVLNDSTERYDTPDRATCRQALDILNGLQPHTLWRLMEIDVPFREAERATSRVIELIRPHGSEMDLSIGLALYFAASAQTSAKVLMSGLGADELLGGYLRHRRRFQREGWVGLAAEMQLDIDRIGTRNLGRDDRCLAAHGKEARYPFLDEDLVAYLTSLPLPLRCDPRLSEGEGDKRLLRLLAQEMGLQSIAKTPKRAMQFGTRSAKRSLADGRVKGTDAVRIETTATQISLS